MATKNIASMSPWYAKGDCPFECIGCEHLVGVRFYNCNDVDIECDLEEEPDEFIQS